MNEQILALLPMKAHSERVPDKNMRLFNGRPLYHAVMGSLLKSKYISQVIINTDSARIKHDAMHFFGDSVVIHDRPEAIQGDHVSMNRIIAHDLENLAGSHFLQTHSTNPLLRTETINKAIKTYFLILKKGYDSLFSVTKLQKRLYDKDWKPINHDPNELIRTQDLPPIFDENSCLYLFHRRGFESAGRRIGINPYLFEIPREEAIDIDEALDFKIAESLSHHDEHTHRKP